jgi:hypothetical protein
VDTHRYQNLNLQKDALEKAGCDRIFEDTISGARTEWQVLLNERAASDWRYFGGLEIRSFRKDLEEFD